MKKRYANKQLALDIGGRIRKLRQARELTIDQLFEKCEGLNRSSLSRIERGLTDPQLSTLHRIAEALNVTLVDLVIDIEGQKK